MSEYDTNIEDIELIEISERNTIKACCMCGKKDEIQCIECSLPVCEKHDDESRADVGMADYPSQY